jgi:hypothetical protein
VNGHLEVLQWLRGNGCPWDAGVTMMAAAKGNLEILKWARAQDPPCKWDRKECLEHAKKNCHSATRDWIESQDAYADAIGT